MVVGSEVPNLLVHDESVLVVSEDVDIAVPVASHAEVKRRLPSLRGLVQSVEEPSVWVATAGDMIEANFLGMEPGAPRPGEAWVHEDGTFPLLVFGTLGYLVPLAPREVDGMRLPLPRPASLALEKLLTDRSGEKYDRDLLVVLGLVLTWSDADEAELVRSVRALPPEHAWTVRANLAALSLLPARSGMPAPELRREQLAALLAKMGEPR